MPKTINMIVTDPKYTRVIPRDLFNEAKLLKCIGRLALLIHEGHGINGMTFDHDDEPFEIALVEDGHLTVTNVNFFINDTCLFFKSTYNSKDNYPLLLHYDNVEYQVFHENGDYTSDFIAICNML